MAKINVDAEVTTTNAEMKVNIIAIPPGVHLSKEQQETLRNTPHEDIPALLDVVTEPEPVPEPERTGVAHSSRSLVRH